ncbi:MAG: helix-turn-helix domain-containing protein [Ruminococcus sp.]|nr:helix-turn-helix domain-containing protein [Ruminococcus sp.]
MKNKIEEKKMCEEVGKRLSELRKINNLTQSQAAEYLGVSQSNMSQIETDVRKISIYSIKKLLELYNASYESVLGELDQEKTNSFFKTEKSLSSIDLLMSVCEQAGSEDLNIAVSAYINMCVYVILREIYEANPRNTNAVFSLDKDSALKKATDFISKTPHHLSAYINVSTGKVKKTLIEPPLEKAADFREFVKSCENYISNYLTK